MTFFIDTSHLCRSRFCPEHACPKDALQKRTQDDNFYFLNSTRTVKEIFLDGCLGSLELTRQSNEVSSSLVILLGFGGFKMANFVSNTKELILVMEFPEAKEKVKEIIRISETSSQVYSRLKNFFCFFVVDFNLSKQVNNHRAFSYEISLECFRLFAVTYNTNVGCTLDPRTDL